MILFTLVLGFAVFSLAVTAFVAVFGGSTFSDLYPAPVEVESADENFARVV